MKAMSLASIAVSQAIFSRRTLPRSGIDQLLGSRYGGKAAASSGSVSAPDFERICTRVPFYFEILARTKLEVLAEKR